MSEPNLDRWAEDIVQRSKGNVWAGLGLTAALHLLQVPIFFILYAIPRVEYGAFLPLIFLGVSQLVYMLPVILFLKKRGDNETVKGLIIGASITFLLNAACSGFFFFRL